MQQGGRAAMWELISTHIAAQQRYERNARFSGHQSLVLLLPFAAAALLARHNGNPIWPLLMWLTVATPVLALVQWLTTRARMRRLHEREVELRGYIRNVIFDYEIWLELLDESRVSEYKLGPIELGKADLSFQQRVASLFRDYPQLASQKSLEPFPGWYRKMYRSGSQRNNQFVDHFWQYALAQVLREEFFSD